MRSTLFALLATAASVCATGTGCLQNLEELVARTSCGDDRKILKCVRDEVDLQRLDKVERCFIAGGCEKADAQVGAVWLVQECQDGSSNAREGLRRRQKLRRAAASDTATGGDSKTEGDSTTQEKTTAKDKTTAKTSAKKTTAAETTIASAAASTTAPSSTDATTTSDSSVSSAAATSTDTTATSTTSDSSTTTSTSASSTTTQPTTTGSLACSVFSTKSTKLCSVSDNKTLGCIPTVTAIGTCAPGNICFSNVAGAEVCMKRDDHLTPSGLAVAVIFGISIVAVTIALIVVYAKAVRKAKQEKKVFLAQATEKRFNKTRSMSDVEAGGARRYSQPIRNANMQSEDNLPLIPEHAPRNDQQYYGQHEAYDQEHVDMGSYAAMQEQRGGGVPPVPPRLHQGLGAVGQQEPHWSEDGGYGIRR